jgi:hypothetical protein
VQGIGGVHEEGGRAGAGEGGCQLGADQAGLAEARHHHAAAGGEQELEGGADVIEVGRRAGDLAYGVRHGRPSGGHRIRRHAGRPDLRHRTSGTVRSPVIWFTKIFHG